MRQDEREYLERLAEEHGFSVDAGTRAAPAPRRAAELAQVRVPPQSIEAEQAVLGGLMLAPDGYDRVADLVSETDFYRRDHQLIFRAVRELAAKSRPFDAVTLGEWFEAQGLREVVAGGAYLIELATTTPSAANIAAYAEIVRDKALARAIITAGTDMVNSGFQPEGRSGAELLTEAQAAVNQIASTGCGSGGLQPVSTGLTGLFTDLQGYYDGTIVPGIPLPWGSLRNVIPGLADGDLVIGGGRPGMGKTILLFDIAVDIAENEGDFAAFSMEMKRRQLDLRMLSKLSGIPMQRLRMQGGVEQEEWPLITEAIGRMKAMPLHVDDQADLTIHQIRARARRLNAQIKAASGGQRRLRGIGVDYIQLVQSAGKRDISRAEAVGDVSRGLKLMAMELDCPVVALSQLNRGAEGRQNKRPNLADLRESGAIEQDADLILLLYREDYYNPDTPARGISEVIVAKQRSGATDTAYLRHDLPCSRFHDFSGKPNYKAAARGVDPDDSDGFDDDRIGSGSARAAPRRGFQRLGNRAADRQAGPQ